MIEFNKVILTARLTRDPETRFLPSGMGVCDMRVAADRSWLDKNTGERQKEPLFISVKAWAKTAEFCQQYMRKGSGILVEGRLQMETWKDKQTGQDREKIVIIAEKVQFAETKAEAEARMSRSGGGGAPGGPGGYDHGDYDAMNEAPASYGGSGGYGAPPSGHAPAAAPPPRASAPPPRGEAAGPGTHDDLPF